MFLELLSKLVTKVGLDEAKTSIASYIRIEHMLSVLVYNEGYW